MKRMHRIVVVTLLSVFVLSVALPVYGATDTPVAETTVTDNHENLKPALPAPPPDVVDEEQPWTVRFIYPTIAIVTVILLVGLVIGYNRSVRGRYTVVSE